MSRLRELETQLRLIQGQLERLEDMPEDIFEPGDVIWFRKQFERGGTRYTYAFLKVNTRQWVGTGPRAPQYIRWEDLCEFMDDAEVWYAREWERL